MNYWHEINYPNLTLAIWVSLQWAPHTHLGLLNWRRISEGRVLSKILAYDWINHMSVIFINMLFQPLTLKSNCDAGESVTYQHQCHIYPNLARRFWLAQSYFTLLRSFSWGVSPDGCVELSGMLCSLAWQSYIHSWLSLNYCFPFVLIQTSSTKY